MRTEESARLWQLDGAGTSVRFSKQVAKLKATVLRPGFTGEKENKPKTNKPNQTSSRRTTCVCVSARARALGCRRLPGFARTEAARWPQRCVPFLPLAAPPRDVLAAWAQPRCCGGAVPSAFRRREVLPAPRAEKHGLAYSGETNW